MIRKMILNSVAALTLAWALPVHAGEIGVTNMTFDAPGRERLVQALVTYPAQAATGRLEWTGDNAIFKGVPLLRDAKPEDRKLPLIILSHGSGGNAASLSWLTKRLAEDGYVVIAPNHQGSTSGDSRPETTIPATWLRKSDMTALLDAAAASPSLSRIADLEDVTAIGFSLGGQTVLGLAGVQFDAKALAGMCDANPKPPGCTWLDHGNSLIKGHVDLRAIDTERLEAPYLEPRVKRVIAIDPAFVPAYAQQSLKAVATQVDFINLGSEAELPFGINARPLADAIPHAKIERVLGANHFSFLAVCKPLAGLMVWWEGDDPVCSPSGDRDRVEIHEEIIAKILAFLHGSRGQ